MSDRKTKMNWKKWRLAFVVFCAVVVVVLGLSYGVRSSYYLSARLTPKLAELGKSIGGRFEFSAIRAMGFTGIILDGVSFIPDASAAHTIRMASITVYPALLGMIAGDLNASLVEVRGAETTFDVRSESGDRAWLSGFMASATGGNVSVESDLGVSGASQALPEIVCRDCRLEAIYGDYHVRISAKEERMRIESQASGTVAFDYQPIDFCVSKRAWGDEVCFSARLSGASLGDSVHIPKAEISGIAHDGVQIHALSLEELEVAKNEDRFLLLVDRGQLDATIDENSDLSKFSGDYLLGFSQVEILHETEKDRLGVGLEIRNPSNATAKVYGGFDRAEQKIGLTLDASKFDLASLFRGADFSDSFRIDALPLTGHVSFIAELAARRFWIGLDADVTEGSVVSSVLARDPLTEISASIKGAVRVDWANKTFAFEDVAGKVGELPFRIEMSRTENDEGHKVFRASVKSRGDSGKFIASLPKGFAPMLTGYQLSGEYGAEVELAFDESNPDDLFLNVDMDLDNVETVAFDPRSNFPLLKNHAFLVRINAATVPLEIGPKDAKWVGFYDLPRHTAYAFVASEDGKFFSHKGFDIRAIRAGLIANLKAHKFVRGGSTISQQVIKNVFLNHDKTASRKFQEAFLTWQMEKNLSKLTIFELYLNLAHFAKDTYGIRAAAEYYFKKNVHQLSLRESLFLASILPNPIIFGGQFLEGKLSSSRLNKMINVGNALRATNRISADDWNAAVPLIKAGKITGKD